MFSCNLEYLRRMPLTLILFILALKPFAVTIQREPSTWAPEISNTHYKILLYTDNILLNNTSPHITLLNLFMTLGFQSNIVTQGQSIKKDLNKILHFSI